MLTYLSVAVGGAFGAVARYGLGTWISNKWIHPFPLHTFVINISGALVLGFLSALFLDKLTVSPEMRMALTALLYTVLSVIIGCVSVYAGMILARLI